MRIATLIVMDILSWGTAGWAAMGFDERYEQVNVVGGMKTAHALTAGAPTRQYGLDGGSAVTMARR
jgi:hypothetical protein